MHEDDQDKAWLRHQSEGMIEDRTPKVVTINGTIYSIPVHRQRLGATEQASYLGWSVRTFYRWSVNSMPFQLRTNSGFLTDTRTLDAFKVTVDATRWLHDDKGRFKVKKQSDNSMIHGRDAIEAVDEQQ